jgi:hypothetical protein
MLYHIALKCTFIKSLEEKVVLYLLTFTSVADRTRSRGAGNISRNHFSWIICRLFNRLANRKVVPTIRASGRSAYICSRDTRGEYGCLRE